MSSPAASPAPSHLILSDTDETSNPPEPLYVIDGDRLSILSEDPSHPTSALEEVSSLQDRQESAISFDTISPTPLPENDRRLTNPFGTPGAEQTNPFSPPASIMSFSMSGDHTPRMSSALASGSSGQPYTFQDLHQRISAVNSVQTSFADLSHSRNLSATVGLREPFASPPRRTIFQRRATSPNNSIFPKRTTRARPRSTMLSLSDPIQKPWLKAKDSTARLAYFITYGVMLMGVAASAVRIYFGWLSVPLLGRVCLVLDEEFQGSELDTENVWMREADMGGFGNGEFEMTTTSSNNSFIRNNHLYLLPTLTSSVIGQDAVLDGYTFNLTGCTNANSTSCGAVSNRTAGVVINPVMSARISTKGKKSIRYGRVEVNAKLPRGDWMWPAIWMLPENNTYGPWPISGEIDIMESRGNGVDYPSQGINYVRGSLNWGPLTWLNGVAKTFGWWSERRSSYDKAFHTYALEWSPEFIRIFVDSRLQFMLQLKFDIPFFERGDFPVSVSNESQQIILPDPWAGAGNSAPFDQSFYLILDVAVGGTNGWFPDNAGNKPWLDGALNAMQLFAESQDEWSATWPEDEEDRAMIVDSVKMWQQC